MGVASKPTGFVGDVGTPRGGRAKTMVFAAAAAVIAMVVAVVVVLIVRGGNGSGSGAAPPAPHTPLGSVAAPSSGATLRASDVTWQDSHLGVWVPTTTAGPHHSAGGRVWGFDRTPAGAVLAAINIFYRTGGVCGPAIFDPTIADQVVGPDKDAFQAGTDKGYASTKDRYAPDAAGRLTATIQKGYREHSGVAAYRVDIYNPDSANIDVVLRATPVGSSTYYVNTRQSVEWVNGDWRLVAPPTGDWSTVFNQITSIPNDYTPLVAP